MRHKGLVSLFISPILKKVNVCVCVGGGGGLGGILLLTFSLGLVSYIPCEQDISMDENFQDYSRIQDFEADFP